ncbi:MAG: tRNA (adenosine(37)-N6)-threonylcarbamoyltransferase complex ATPase subunit type 1 TsaE [Actinomycetota bacterium]
MMRSIRVVTRSPEETRILGASLAPTLLPGDVISLSGELGSGKTVFVQGLAAALGVHERVTSPTFTIVHEYAGRYPIVHLDIYRLDSFQELLDLGFEEFLDPDAILVLEWGEAVEPLLPRAHLRVEIRRTDDPDAADERIVTFRATGEEWSRKLFETRSTADALLDAASDEQYSGSRFSDVPVTRDHRAKREPRTGDA